MAERSRVVWVTGASTGIGKALAELFAVKGDIVVATSRTRSKLASLQRKILRDGGACDIAFCDVRSEKSVSHTVRKILAKHHRVDILINNAGVTYFKDFLSTTVKEFDQVVSTNLVGLFTASRAVIPSMLKNRSGIILNIISFAAKTVYTKSAAYSASKYGAEGMMNVLRAEVRDKGIKVINVYPGAVLTSMWLPKERKKFAPHMITPRQVADFVYESTNQPPEVMIEEIVIRPQGGDLKA